MPVKNNDVVFEVREDGKKMGELHISKGGVNWKKGVRGKQIGMEIKWKKLAKLIEEHGTKKKP